MKIYEKIKLEDGVTSYDCLLCDYAFLSSESLSSHLFFEHQINRAKGYIERAKTKKYHAGELK